MDSSVCVSQGSGSQLWRNASYIVPITRLPAPGSVCCSIPSAHRLSWLIDRPLSGRELHIPVIWPAGAVGMGTQSNKHRADETSEPDRQLEELPPLRGCSLYSADRAWFSYRHTLMVRWRCCSSMTYWFCLHLNKENCPLKTSEIVPQPNSS